jgi:Glycosyl hydrolases family 16
MLRRKAVRGCSVIVVSTAALGAVACGSTGNPYNAAPTATISQSPDDVPTFRGQAGFDSATPEERSRSAASTAAGAVTSRTAAGRYGWTDLVARDDFNGSSLHPSWRAYNSAGHAGNGIRSPEQITLSNGILRMIGTPTGTTAGMDWDHPQKYGRWETRARFPAGCGCYHPVMILWPAEHPWPLGGEIDYAEVTDPARQTLKFFVHYGADNRQIGSAVRVDMTQWHNLAVEWSPDHITGYVDGKPFFHTSRRAAQPPGPMRQTIQLDWFPSATKGRAILEVDWATIYRW